MEGPDTCHRFCRHYFRGYCAGREKRKKMAGEVERRRRGVGESTLEV